MSTASAPGKIILFGEHAVVYGRPALAVPVFQVHADVRADFAPGLDGEGSVWIDAPDVGLHAALAGLDGDHPLRAAVEHTLKLLGVTALPPARILITSTIPVASGLGSGAAVSVALVRALAGLLGRELAAEEVSAIAYEVERLHHGTPSGIDNTVIAHARPVYFVRGQPIQTFPVGRAFTLVIADTGMAAPTKESVGDVRRLWEADPSRWERVFDAVADIVVRARQLIELGACEDLGPLMDANHALLQEMTVSSPELDRLVHTARQAGALGAKLSGGGRGGNMIALSTLEKAGDIAAALLETGARHAFSTSVGAQPSADTS